MIQKFFDLLGSYPMALLFCPAEQAIRVEKKGIAGLKFDRCFSEFRSFDQT